MVFEIPATFVISESEKRCFLGVKHSNVANPFFSELTEYEVGGRFISEMVFHTTHILAPCQVKNGVCVSKREMSSGTAMVKCPWPFHRYALMKLLNHGSRH